VGLTATDFGLWQYLNDVEGRVYGVVLLPSNLATTPNANIGLSVAANATTGSTRMTVSTKSVSNAASLNPSSLTAETALDTTVPATAWLRKDITFPASGNLGVTVVANDVLLVEITHNGDHANDTLAVPTNLVAAWLQVDVT